MAAMLRFCLWAGVVSLQANVVCPVFAVVSIHLLLKIAISDHPIHPFRVALWIRLMEVP
jgi:hypothetical protein